MLKQKPLSYYQSSIFAKKPKKRSTSTSANKENLSITHNNSIILEPNGKTQINSKLLKNAQVNKQKSKKTKKSQTRQRSTSKLPLTNASVHDQNKQILSKPKQTQPHAKKAKKSRNNSSSIIYPEQVSKSNYKSFLNDHSQFMQTKSKQVNPKPKINNFLPEMSKSSTVVSSSTGNIQFSEWSREDPHYKNYDLLSVNQLMTGINKQIRSANSSQRNQCPVKSAREMPVASKYILSPTRAAIMIQKTWRGYLTRKLLSQYINSFEPLYEQQLKDIRSGRQSRNEARSMISSNRKCQEKSSFFDRSELEECSEIYPMDSQVSESFRTTGKVYNETGSLVFTENNQPDQVLKGESELRQTGKSVSGKVKGNEDCCELPVQFFKKAVVVSTAKRDQSQQMRQKNNEDFSCSSRRKNAMKVTPETASRISEFTANHQSSTSPIQQTLIQQTLKHPHNIKPRNLSLCAKTIVISISPHIASPISQLQTHCKSLSALFHSFNAMCISQLKKQINMNQVTIKQLMERKDALKDIVDNGMEFVKNVGEQIAKAFSQMDRIVKEGCDSTSDRQQREYASSSESHIDSSASRPQIPRAINLKPNNQTKPQPKASQSQKMSNQKYIQDLQSPAFSQDSQLDSSTSRKYKRYVRQNTKSGTSEFYTIDLPTEEYSAKGKSPIQQDYDEEDSSYRQEDYEPNDHQASEQEEYTQPTLRMNQLYASHQQSLQILNQFLLNLIQEYQEATANKAISELEYLCETLKRVSCDSQNKTIIDRCLIEFIVEIMSETWTLRQIYEGFRRIVQRGVVEEEDGQDGEHGMAMDTEEDWKLINTIRKWIEELYKWEMNIIQQVPSKMESSSFINTENLSLNQLRDAVNNLTNPTNFQLDINTHYK